MRDNDPIYMDKVVSNMIIGRAVNDGFRVQNIKAEVSVTNEDEESRVYISMTPNEALHLASILYPKKKK